MVPERAPAGPRERPIEQLEQIVSNEAGEQQDHDDRSGWAKSTYSGADQCCVETRSRDGFVQVRDSKEVRAGLSPSVLNFTQAEWRAFIAGVKDGEFDC